ncbi:MAG: ATP-binding cassette domain-containing protein [Oscillospiraceae bacterium]|nr:ATP-binding cassette domain-containing protein [Oscillospiraceae bacterium]
MKLEVRGLKKSFGEKVVLDGVSFACESGVATGLLGRNGAGKTTAIRSVLGIISRDGGEVLLDGNPLPSYYEPIGYLPEERGLYPKIKVSEQLTYFATLRGMKPRQARAALDKWLERLEMTEYRDKNFETLSKGNQQKIQLAAALLHDPDIIILDEPFSGLDPVNALLLKSVVLELIAEGKLLVFSSHQMNFVEEFCQEVIMIHEGHLVLQGSLSQIKRSYDRDRAFVRLRRSEADIAADLRVEGVLDVKPHNGGFLLELDKEDRCQGILKALMDKNHDIDDFHLVELSLGDIFIQKAGVAL